MQKGAAIALSKKGNKISIFWGMYNLLNQIEGVSPGEVLHLDMYNIQVWVDWGSLVKFYWLTHCWIMRCHMQLFGHTRQYF